MPRRDSASSSSSHSSPSSSPIVGRSSSKDGAPMTAYILRRRRNSGRGQSSSPTPGRRYPSPSSTQGRRLGDPIVIKGTKRSALGGRGGVPVDWKQAGGPGRDHNVLMEIELDKVCGRLLMLLCHEVLHNECSPSFSCVSSMRPTQVTRSSRRAWCCLSVTWRSETDWPSHISTSSSTSTRQTPSPDSPTQTWSVEHSAVEL